MTNRISEPQASSAVDLSVVARTEWTARQVVLGTLTIIGVATVFLLFYRLYMVVFLLFAAIALQVALSPIVEWFYRRRIPRGMGVMFVYATLVILLGLSVWFGAPPIVSQATTVAQDAAGYYEAGRAVLMEAPVSLVRRLGHLLPEEFSLPMLMSLADTGEGQENNGSNLDLVWLVVRTILAILAIFVLAYYWTLEGDTILRKFVMKAPSQQRTELRSLIVEFQGKIGAYFRGTAILCAIVGVASTIAFLLIGIPQAILLGLVMAVFEAIPIVGPILGAIPAILLTLAVAPEKIFWVVGALLLIQGLEGNILVPRVMDESVGVNPIVSLLAITAFGALFGIGGAILAIPLAAIVQILLARLLFNTPVRQDAVTPPSASGSMSRSRVGVLRLETQEVIQDLHKDPGTEEDETATRTALDQTADQLEAVAVELDAWLAQVERNRHAPESSGDPTPPSGDSAQARTDGPNRGQQA